MAKHWIGWIPDKVDPRDFKYSALLKAPGIFKDEVDLRSVSPAIYSQGATNSCVGNAVGASIDFYYTKLGYPHSDPSRLFIYFNGRDLDGTPYEDIGCTIRNSIKGVVKLGVCSEESWPYIISNVIMRPYQTCYDEAISNKVSSYYRMDYVIDDFKQCLSEGFPFTIGVRVFENFPMSTETGIIPMPSGKILGGHAMLVVGYISSIKMFIVRNSWGPLWGENGYGFIPFEYVLNNGWAGDFWTIRSLKVGDTPTSELSTKEGCIITLLKTIIRR